MPPCGSDAAPREGAAADAPAQRMARRPGTAAARGARTSRGLGPRRALVPLALLAALACPGATGVTTAQLWKLVISPPSAVVRPGETLRFSSYGLTSLGDSAPITVTWTAQAGTITPDGLYTAGSVPGVDLVFAASSSGALADTVLVAITTPVSAIRIVPDTTILYVGQSGRLRAILFDDRGDTTVGPAVTWTSGDTGIAQSFEDGFVLALAEGATTITATSEGVSGSAVLSVTARPDSTPWPNEPPAFRPATDQPWDVVDGLGWIVQFGFAAVVPDLSAPLSAPSVLELVYPVGFAGGSAPGTLWLRLSGARRVYAGIWWQASSPWQGHNSNVNKIQFLFPSDGGDITMVMYGPPGGPYELRVIPQFPGRPSNWLTPNVRNVPITLGRWHQIEWLVDYSAGDGTGLVRWWLDGDLIGDHANVPFPPGVMTDYKISPTWGGVGDVKTRLDYFRYDHTHVSVR